MSPEYTEDVKSVIKSYQFTVVSMAIVIVASLFTFGAILAYTLLVYVPDRMYAVLEDFHANTALIEEQ